MTAHRGKPPLAKLIGLVGLTATVVAVVAAIAYAAAPVNGAKYAGHLKQATSETVSFEVSASGKKVTNVRVKPFLPNRCGSGGTPPPEVSKPAKIKGGKFTAKVKEELTNGLVSGRATVTGKFLPGGKETGVVKVPIPEAPECSGKFPYTTSAAKRGR